MKVYCSHPIAGRSAKQIQRDEEKLSEEASWRFADSPRDGDVPTIVLPLQIPPWCREKGTADRVCPPGRTLPGDTHTVPCYMRADLIELLTCDALLAAPGWQASVGCMAEINLAVQAGIPVHFAFSYWDETGDDWQ